MTPDFNRAERLARQLRLFQSSTDLALDILKADFDLPVIFDSFQNYSKLTGVDISDLMPCSQLRDGYLVKARGYSIILYDETMPYGKEHTNWTLAHEIGHIYLEHEKDGKKEEVEAHWFAAEFLSPEPIIREIGKRLREHNLTIQNHNIQSIFLLSKEASEKRISSLSRKCLFNDEISNELIAMYSDEIENCCRNICETNNYYNPILDWDAVIS